MPQYYQVDGNKKVKKPKTKLIAVITSQVA